VEAAKSREPEVRTAGILALGWLGEEAQSAAPLVVAALRDGDASIRSAASHALGTLGDSSDAVLDGLAAVLTDADRSVRYGAIVSLGALGKRSDRVATTFTKRLLAPGTDPYDCGEIVRMLAFDGTVLEAKTQLTDAFEKDPKAPLSVAFALRALDAPSSEEAFARLTSALADGTDPRTVLAYLRMLGPKAVPATAAVVPFLSNGDAAVRTTAAVALGAFGPGARDALPALELATKDADATVVLAAKQAIAQISASPDRPK
jgi:HEAT repeat protein